MSEVVQQGCDGTKSSSLSSDLLPITELPREVIVPSNLASRRKRDASSSSGCQRRNRNNLYITNVPLALSKEELFAELQRFGQIQHVRSVNEKGVAFVRYSQEYEARLAIFWCNGRYWSFDSDCPVRVKFALSDYQMREPARYRVKDAVNVNTTIVASKPDSIVYKESPSAPISPSLCTTEAVSTINPVNGQPTLVIMDSSTKQILLVL